MIKTQFLIPKQDNQGRSFPVGQWKELEKRLIRFGGYTWEDGQVGAWRDDGRTFRGVSRRYVVDLSSWGDLAEWLEVVGWARERFRQETIYLEVAGIPEIMG